MRKSRDLACRFELAPQDCDGLITTIMRSGAVPTQKRKQISILLDTRDAAIGNHGLASGIRHEGEFAARNLKAIAEKAAARQNPKGWTRFVEPLCAATPPEARRWLRAFLGRKEVKGAIFRIESQTNSWSEPRAEIRLERLRLIAGRKQASLAVATFTCPNGAADFFRFIAEICASAKLHLSAGSAALQAYRHFGALRAMHVSAFAPKLRSEMTVEDAFKTIARACLDQFLLNESAVRLGADCEAVHQCRVALRRLLASLRFFSGIVSGPELDALRPELKQVARYFQKPRDLDVLIGEVFPASPPKEFVEIIEERRGSAYEALGGALCSQETANFFTRFLAWIEAGDWTQDPARDLSRKEKIVAFVERKLTNATEKFKSRCAALDHADEEERHKIRIRAKNLRYSAEFFEGLVKSGKHRNARRFHAFVGALKDLQTILGRENDAHMGRRFLASLAQEMGQDRKAKKAPLIAIAALSGRIEGLSEPEYRRKIGKARRAFAEIKPFWDKIPLKKNLETAKKFEG